MVRLKLAEAYIDIDIGISYFGFNGEDGFAIKI